MRLYYHPVSTCSRRVLMTAHRLGIQPELVLVDLTSGQQHSPAFLALNPNHRVPVLEHDGLVLWESYAIMQYLADVTPGQTIYPLEPGARADVNRWLFWCGQYFMPGVGILNWENSIKAMIDIGPADPAEVSRGESLFVEAAKILDAHLGDRMWMCDTGLSLADFALAAPLADRHSARLPMDDRPNIQRWLERVQALDAWKATAPGAL